jgi:hypothetical protein
MKVKYSKLVQSLRCAVLPTYIFNRICLWQRAWPVTPCHPSSPTDIPFKTPSWTNGPASAMADTARTNQKESSKNAIRHTTSLDRSAELSLIGAGRELVERLPSPICKLAALPGCRTGLHHAERLWHSNLPCSLRKSLYRPCLPIFPRQGQD